MSFFKNIGLKTFDDLEDYIKKIIPEEYTKYILAHNSGGYQYWGGFEINFGTALFDDFYTNPIWSISKRDERYFLDITYNSNAIYKGSIDITDSENFAQAYQAMIEKKYIDITFNIVPIKNHTQIIVQPIITLCSFDLAADISKSVNDEHKVNLACEAITFTVNRHHKPYANDKFKKEQQKLAQRYYRR